MSKHKKGAHKSDESGLRSFWMMKNDSFFELTYGGVRHIQVSRDGYTLYYDQFAQCSKKNRRIYRGLLESNLAVWMSWVQAINPMKIAVTSGISIVFVTLLFEHLTKLNWVKLLRHPLLLLHTVMGQTGWVVVVEFILIFLFLLVLLSGAKVSIKIEKASFLLRVLNDTIDSLSE